MRIKCPNSDIYLELPGDRTDMKFTCPACHKVHRVKISITTPGEDPAPPAESHTRSMTRTHTQVPKKYATGSYAPVVDIPIDANFVLLEGKDVQSGVDLGKAAATETPQPTPPPPPPPAAKAEDAGEPPIGESREQEEPAETMPESPAATPSEPEQPEESKQSEEPEKLEESERAEESKESAAPSEAALPEDTPEEPRAENEARTETTAIPRPEDPALPPPLPSEAGETRIDSPSEKTGESHSIASAWGPSDAPAVPRASERHSLTSSSVRSRRHSARRARPRHRSRALPVLLVLLLLGGAGYVTWQEHLFRENRKELVAALDQSDAAWSRGDFDASARHNRTAEEILRKGGDFHTLRNLYNRASEATGWFAPLESSVAGEEKALADNRRSEKRMAEFRRELVPGDTRQMALLLADTVSPNGDDSWLDPALRRAVTGAVMDNLERLAAEGELAEELLPRSRNDEILLAPHLPLPERQEFAERLVAFRGKHQERFETQIGDEIAEIAQAADAGDVKALGRFRALDDRLTAMDGAQADMTISRNTDEADRETIRQLRNLVAILRDARTYAHTSLSRSEDEDGEFDILQRQAEDESSPNKAMAQAAMAAVDEARAQAYDLLRLRMEVYGRVQSEMRRGRTYAGTRMAWSMLRMAFDDSSMSVDPDAFKFDTASARMEFTVNGRPAVLEMREEDYEQRIRAVIDGYRFTTGWALLFRKPVKWMATLAGEMWNAGVPADLFPEWELLEGPGAPLALGVPAAGSDRAFGNVAERGRRQAFFQGDLRPVTELPLPEGALQMVDDFRQAATRLHDAVMAEESISQPLRQALKPVLMGTYQQPDPRDYFDSDFCRRLIEADYLETYIKPMPPAIQDPLDMYRETLGKVEAGYDEFSMDMGSGTVVYATTRLDADFSGEGRASDQDPETGESLPRYDWRVEEDDETIFYSPLPSRFVYAFMLADHYSGRHSTRPAGVPDSTGVCHPTKGMIAHYVNGAESAVGSEDLWNEAIAEDSSGRFDPSIGPPGWNFPLHVLQRDDQGDPVVLATLSGFVKSPDFSAMPDEEIRRKAEDDWLDSTAATLSTPGELGLIFHQFFRYCSDSPLPELPNLIGSHFGLSDTHQTVYESLERRWVGRLIGDCDDLAEFFQVLTRRQGKLSHVMQLPGHAACGYVETTDDGEYRFVVLQTGPVMQFVAPTLNEAVEVAYRSFDRGDGVSHMTTDAVPLLLRFANEETRTPFVLSARIYGDAEYAETMIEVQAYWHEHVYSAALKVMEELVAEDQEIGNIKELGSLYERVGFYDKSTEMRYRELEMVKDQPQAAISTLLEIVQLHLQEKNRDKAVEALGMMEERMLEMIRRDDAPEFFRAMTFRSYWALFMARVGQPARAWRLVKYDASMTKRQLGRVAEPVLRTMVTLYDRMAMQRDNPNHEMTEEETAAMEDVRRELNEAFGRGYFKSDDSYNNIIARYFVLGRYAVSDAGREKGLERILADGPYPAGPREHTRRSRSLNDEDWEWFRIAPQLYLVLALERLDQEEYPELYDPEAAKPILEDVSRAVEKGTGLGSDVAGGDDVIKADLALSFLNNDIDAFRRVMTVVKDKDYSSLYDDAALTFGLHCGLIPQDEFPDWIRVFREFFPGSQHYFKVVYRAIDKENYDHALLMAEATAEFFPDMELLRQEAEFVRSIIPGLKQRKAEREAKAPPAAPEESEARPAA